MSALPSVGPAEQAAVGADATRDLYERHSSRIFAFCRSRLGTREEAEDATQTTFLNAFRSLRGGLVPQFELPWLFRIADNVCRDRRKSAWRRGRLEAVTDLQELQDVVAAPERAPDALAGLDEALAGMPERQRRALVLREWQGLSYAEIAAELGVSKAAVETLIFRARRSLARGLEAPVDRRRRAGLDAGWLLGLAKSLLTGGGAVKLAAAAAVTGASLVAVAPLRDGPPAAPRPVPAVPEPARPAPSTVRAPVRTVPRTTVAPPAQREATPARSVAARPADPAPPTARATAPPAAPAGKAQPKNAGAPPPLVDSTPSAPAAAPPSPSAPPPVATNPPPPAPPPPPAALPELPAVPPVPPPALPPVPDLPVEVPELPSLPPLPPLP